MKTPSPVLHDLAPRQPTLALNWSVLAQSGVALVLLGAPLAWIVRDLMGGGTSPIFAAVPLVLGSLLVLDPRSVRRGRLEASAAEIAPMTIYFFVIAVLCLAPVALQVGPTIPENGKSRGIGPMDTKGLIEAVIMATFMVGMFTHRLEDFRNLPKYFAVFGTISICALVVSVASSQALAISFFVGARLGGVGEEQAESPMTPATIAAFTLMGTIVWLKAAPRFRFVPALFATIAIPACFLVLLASRARTVLVGVLLMAIVLGFMSAIRRRLGAEDRWPSVTAASGWSRSVIAYVMLMAALVLASLYYVRFYENFWSIMNQTSFVAEEVSAYIWDAVEALLFGNTLADPSTAARVRQVSSALDGLTWLGRGYKANYIDAPLLQAFYDLGVIGGCFYFLVFIAIPLRAIWGLLLSADRPPTVHLAIACYLVLFPRFFFGAEPYYYPTVIIVVFFYATAVRYWSRQAAAWWRPPARKTSAIDRA